MHDCEAGALMGTFTFVSRFKYGWLRHQMGRRVFRHMIDVGFIDRVRGGIGIQDVLKGGVIKGEGFTGLIVAQIIVYMRIWMGWITGWSFSG